MANKQSNLRQRESGIEALKIIAMFMIVLYHSTQTLNSQSTIYASQHYMLAQGMATANIQRIIILLFGNLAGVGNMLFFICSAWFLCKSKKQHKRKLLYMLADVWVISIIWLIVILGMGFHISSKYLIMELFPTTFENNWYITAYAIFYLIYPGLNIIVDHLSQRQHLLTITIMWLMYFVLCWIISTIFFPSVLIFWLTVYFVVAYVRNYLSEAFSNPKVLLTGLAIGLIGLIGMDLLTNFLALHIGVLNGQVTRWQGHNNPFAVLVSLSLFGLGKRRHWVSQPVNYIASLSLLMYVIHENLLFRTYVRPLYFIWVKETFGYGNILAWLLLFAVALFFAAMILGWLYKESIQKKLYKLCDRVYPKLKALVYRYSDFMMKLH